MNEEMTPSGLITRLWMLDLRRKSFIEIGGTSPPREIWRRVRHRIETEKITNCDVPLALSPEQTKAIKRRARSIAEDGVASGTLTIVSDGQ
jgi:hypothetical protein